MRLKTGGSVPPHDGTTNLRMKCHLALEVPHSGNRRAQQRGAWVEVGGSEGFLAGTLTLEDGWKGGYAQQHQASRRVAAGVVTWHAPGQVEAFDDSFVHAVGNSAHWHSNRHDSSPDTLAAGTGSADGSRTVLEVSFWHPLLREEGWLLPSNPAARRALIRSSVAEASETPLSRDSRSAGGSVRIEVDYNGVWNRGVIAKVREPPLVGAPGVPGEESSAALLAFVRYDSLQTDQQCSDEWLLLDCESMRWSQSGFGGGGFRVRPA